MSRTRRSLLAGAGTAAAAALAGCTALSGPRLAHYVEVANATGTVHNVFVRVTGADGEDCYRQQFRLRPETVAEATEPFTGDPSTLTVAVDGAAPVERPWPENRCEERGVRSAGGAEVRLTGEDVTVGLACDTVTADG